MKDQERELQKITRRALFKELGYGIGGLALTQLLAESALGQSKPQSAIRNPQFQDPLLPKKPHFAAKAKNIIYMFMAGAPSQVDLFDYKPNLVKHSGEPCPEEILKGERFAFIRGVPKLLGSPRKWAQCGQLSEAYSRTVTLASAGPSDRSPS